MLYIFHQYLHTRAAKSKEEKARAEAAKEKAAAEALKNKEKRLRLQLGAAVKLRHHPKLIVSIDEAKEAKIEGEIGYEYKTSCQKSGFSDPPSPVFPVKTIRILLKIKDDCPDFLGFF